MSKSIPIHTKQDFLSLKDAGQLAAKTLALVKDIIKPGISTEEINTFCHNFIVQQNAIPAPLNYHGFPKSVCTSINSVVCHGIPCENEILQDGDIINVDVTVILDGWHGDTSKTFLVGESFVKNKPSTLKAKKLVETALSAMNEGISLVRPGNTLLHIAEAIQKVSESEGFSVVKDYCGHGTGRKFHQPPVVLHYVPTGAEAKNFENITLKPGMVFTIEPMINSGGYQVSLSKKDGWTVRTMDGSLSAQFEHTIGVTDDGCEIFTLLPP